MKRFKLLTIGLVIGLAGVVYAAGTPTGKAITGGGCPFCKAQIARR